MNWPTSLRPFASQWKRSVGGGMIVLGSLLLLTAGTSAARGAIARDAARTRWAELEAERAVAGGRRAVTRSGRTAIMRGTPVARLVIPRIGLDEIVVEGVSDADLRAGPGHMIGSAFPGAPGNAVVSAHRDRHFRSLGRLVVGDTIHTESDAGRVSWTVSRVRVVDADARVLWSTRVPALTLTTCWPIRFFGPAPDRLIVEATPVS
ncbi:MAG TPA: class D sortase [Gemmatimonadaceae bacterium]|nr:class D sortase [Gemmatimonadaceae bacterium]